MLKGQWSFFSDIDASSLIPLLDAWKVSGENSGVFALVAEASKDTVGLLQQLCIQSEMPLIGAIFPEIIHDATFARQGVLLIKQNEMPEYLLTDEIHDDAQMDKLSAQIAELTAKTGHQSLFMVFDSMVPNIASILDRLYLNLADSIDYSGVNAGSETFQPMPCLFDSGLIVQNGVLAILKSDTGRHLLSHGYPMPERLIMATSSSGNCIENIDWQPAFGVYQELARENYGTEITADNFYEIAVHFPFGLVLGTGETLIRIPVGLSEQGSLFCVGEVPENSMLAMMQGDEAVLMESVRRFSQRIEEANVKGLIFYCAGRRMHLGVEQATKELASINNHGEPLIGALSLGEIGVVGESSCPQFHNAALVYSPW